MFVSRINELLAEKGRIERRQVTQDELARFVGVSRQVISTWASPKGVKTINAEHLAQLCTFFDIGPEAYHKIYHLEFGAEPPASLKPENN